MRGGLSSFTRKEQLLLNTILNWYIYDQVVSGSYLYALCDVNPLDIAQVNLTTGQHELSVECAAGEQWAGGLISVGEYLYVGRYDSPGEIVRFTKSPLARVDALTLQAGDDDIVGLVSDGTYIYALCDTIPGRVVKVRISDFTRIGALDFGGGEDEATSGLVLGGYLYVGLYTSPAIVKKVRLSDFSDFATLTFALGEDYIWGPKAIDTDGSYLYVGLDMSPAKMVKVDLGTFTETGVVNFIAGEDRALGVVVSGDYAYAQCNIYPTPSKVVQVQRNPFNRIGAVTFSANDEEIQSGSIVEYGGKLYSGCWWAPARIVKTDEATFAREGNIVLTPRFWEIGDTWKVGNTLYIGCRTQPVLAPTTGSSGVLKYNLLTKQVTTPLYTYPGEMPPWRLLKVGDYLYIAYYRTTGWVLKIDLTTFTRVGTLVLPAGEEYLTDLKTDGTYLYALSQGVGATGRYTRISLATFTRVDAVDLGYGTCFDSEIVSGFAYVGAVRPAPPVNNGRIVKVDLAGMAVVDGLNLSGADATYPRALEYDPDGGFLYAGVPTSPVKVYQIDLAAFSEVGNITLNPGENYTNAMRYLSGILYVLLGTDGAPGGVAKVRTSDFTRIAGLNFIGGEEDPVSINFPGD